MYLDHEHHVQTMGELPLIKKDRIELENVGGRERRVIKGLKKRQ